jgi:pilus assembly protein CpaB
MTARRLALAAVFALVFSGIFTFWLSRAMNRPHAAAPMKLRYVAVAREMDAGALLKPEDLKQIEWPANLPLRGAFSKPEEVVGRSILFPLAPDEPVLDRQLAAVGAGVGLTAKIPEGMRAVSLKSDEVVGVAGFLLPGTHVDVLVTWRSATSAEPVTATVLGDVQVLAAGHQMQPDPEGKPSSVNVVTLLVKPEEAEKAVLASTQGSVQFVLRNGSDRSGRSSAPIGLNRLMGLAQPETQAAVRKPVKTGPKPYVVETLMGGKQTTNSFSN